MRAFDTVAWSTLQSSETESGAIMHAVDARRLVDLDDPVAIVSRLDAGERPAGEVEWDLLQFTAGVKAQRTAEAGNQEVAVQWFEIVDRVALEAPPADPPSDWVRRRLMIAASLRAKGVAGVPTARQLAADVLSKIGREYDGKVIDAVTLGREALAGGFACMNDLRRLRRVKNLLTAVLPIGPMLGPDGDEGSLVAWLAVRSDLP